MASGAHGSSASSYQKSSATQPCADEGGNAQPPYGHLSLPRRLAPGAGGEIRDEGATGRGSKPKAGLTGFTVSKLWGSTVAASLSTLPARCKSWSEGPLGGAAFNNEFGRPNLNGYFREYEQERGRRAARLPQAHHDRGRPGRDRCRADARKSNSPLARCSSSWAAPACASAWAAAPPAPWPPAPDAAELDFDSVQRGNPEIERRAQEVINHCWAQAQPTPSWPSTTWARAACPTPSPS